MRNEAQEDVASHDDYDHDHRHKDDDDGRVDVDNVDNVDDVDDFDGYEGDEEDDEPPPQNLCNVRLETFFREFVNWVATDVVACDWISLSLP